MPHKSKRTKRRRKKAAKGRKARRFAERLASLPRVPHPSRRLVGIGSRGVSITISFDHAREVPYDPDDPVRSAERNYALVRQWDENGNPTEGEA